MIKVGSVWVKKFGEWDYEAGQLVIVEDVTITKVKYRYSESAIHQTATRSQESFLKKMELIKE